MLVSAKASGKLLLDTTRVCNRTKLGRSRRAYSVELGLFFWSLMTSLIFAELGSKALSFFGEAGKIIGFVLGLFGYFATCYMSAKIYVSNLFDKNSRLKQRHLERLELLHPSVDNQMDLVFIERNVNQALKQWLAQIEDNWTDLPKVTKKVWLLQRVAPVLGYGLAFVMMLPIALGYLPEAVEGAELIFHVNIGKNAGYQNAGSFVFGLWAVALSLFFTKSILWLGQNIFFTPAWRCMRTAELQKKSV